MERRVAELHITNARARALRLFQTGSTIFPEEWATQIDEQTVVDLAEFAIHARRVVELCDLRSLNFTGADSTRHKYTVVPPEPLEANFHDALNKLIHAKTYAVGHAIWDGPKVFTASAQNMVVSYMRISTDRRPSSCISVFGLAWCFLTQVIPSLKSRHPEIQF